MWKSWWTVLFFLFTMAVAAKHPCHAGMMPNGIQDGPDGVDTLGAGPAVCLTLLADYPSGNALRDLDAIRQYDECVDRRAELASLLHRWNVATPQQINEMDCGKMAETSCEKHGGVNSLGFTPSMLEPLQCGGCSWKCEDGTRGRYVPPKAGCMSTWV